MKKRLFFILMIATTLVSCEKGDTGKSDTKTDPKNPNEITEVIVVPNGVKHDGDMPEPTNGGVDIDMVMVDSTVSYSAGSQVKLPISYSDFSGSEISGIYFQVLGADTYFEVPINGAGASGNMLLPVGIPTNVAEGEFCIKISVFNSDGKVSQQFSTCISVTGTYSCGVTRVSGGEGVTSTLHNMGNLQGNVKIEYETYTVPDRIDIFYNNVWVAGTGSSPGELGMVPPLADCNSPTDGYVGENGVFCFDFEPSEAGNFIEVIVSGCVRGGTRWEYTLSCAGADACDYSVNELSIKSNTLKITYPETGNVRELNYDPSDVSAYTNSFDIGTADYYDNNGIELNLGTYANGIEFSKGLVIDDFSGNFSEGFDLQVNENDPAFSNASSYSESSQGNIVVKQYETVPDWDGYILVKVLELEFNDVKCGSLSSGLRVVSGTVLISR